MRNFNECSGNALNSSNKSVDSPPANGDLLPADDGKQAAGFAEFLFFDAV
jgi:hypothetical protein